MPTGRTCALVLKVSSYAESDKLVTFYSPDIGRVTSIAKGAKRSKRRFVNKLEEFCQLQITYRPPKNGGLLFLSEAELEDPFLTLRKQYPCYVAAMLVSELVLNSTSEHDPDPKLFSLLQWFFQTVNQGGDPLQNAALFHLRLLSVTGFQPGLDCCNMCGARINTNRSFALQPAHGALVCNRCNSNVQQSKFSLSIQTIKFLQTAQQIDIKRLKRLHLPPKTALETLQVLYRYSQHLLQKDIHSWRFISTIQHV